jgi:hypothetical protein
MPIEINEVLAGIGIFITTYIISNIKLKDGVTEWFVNFIGKTNYNISQHNIIEDIKKLTFESHLNEYNNKVKTELYYFYTGVVLTTMSDFAELILEKEKKLSFKELKSFISMNMYDKFSSMNILIDSTIKMPDELQSKFDKLNNYLTKQHTYSIDNALQSPNKKLLLVQVLDAIYHNSRWFLFYTTEMFENYNGHFDKLSKKDVFIN